jgi:alpha-D-xyloside xylohydrolase
MKLERNLILFAVIASFSLISCNRHYTKTEHGIKTDVGSTVTEIQFYSPEIVRIIKSEKGFDFRKTSLSVKKSCEGLLSVNGNDSFFVAAPTVWLSKSLVTVRFHLLRRRGILSRKKLTDFFLRLNSTSGRQPSL